VRTLWNWVFTLSICFHQSSHIPYRDSKLTRILQESLGGNSRTTLIINCSPSSYNDAETVGTLRFGTRAKSIKNKAKINQELSAAELKLLLKKAKTEAITFTQYIAGLENEITIWRQGGTVPKADWVTMEKIQSGSGAPPLSSLPGHMASQDPSRPSTPATVLDDERDELLKRQNELESELAEKEAELTSRLETLKEEATILNEQHSLKIDSLKLQLEKATHDNKEGAITVESLREANNDLSRQLDELKEKLTEMRLAQKESIDGEKEKKKMEKMAQMMADLDPSGEISAKEAQLRETLFKLEMPGGLSAEETIAIRKEIATSRSLIEQHEQTMSDLQRENAALTMKRDELELRLQAAELEYEELLDKTIAEEEANSSINVLETISELRTKVEAQYASKRDLAQQEIESLKQELARRNEDIQRLSINVTELKRGNEELKDQIERRNHTGSGLWEGKDMTERERDMERIRKAMAQQLADFDLMKKAMMRDLQNRCERVVELEISLDETKEQYNNVLRNNNNKAQQKKMAFLERNLEQLTTVQKQLVEQNTALKKQVAINERKLETRNERIDVLEGLLQEAQEKMSSQNIKYVSHAQRMPI